MRRPNVFAKGGATDYCNHAWRLGITGDLATGDDVGNSAMPYTAGIQFLLRRESGRAERFCEWLVGQTVAAATYIPATTGIFAFRARLRLSATGAAIKMVATGCDHRPKSLGIRPCDRKLVRGPTWRIAYRCKDGGARSTSFSARTGCRADAASGRLRTIALEIVPSAGEIRAFSAVEPITSC